MRILAVNQDWFVDDLRAAGHEVWTCGMQQGCDFPLEMAGLHIGRVLARLPNPYEIDAIIVFDNSAPIPVSGMNEIDIPSVFLAVDTHHHISLHLALYELFDYMLVAQKDYIPRFSEQGYTVEWMPLWASRPVEPSSDKLYQASFVGTLNATLNPDRVKFFEQLKNIAPITVCAGDYAKFFPHSEIVVNQSVKGDLNFRVFEAMLCGSALLTERASNGLLELFNDQEHLLLYERNNVEDCARVINQALTDTAKLRRIGHAGREEILRAHMPKHRAARINQILAELKPRKKSRKNFAAMINSLEMSLRLERLQPGASIRTIAGALDACNRAITEREECNEAIACQAIMACQIYDKWFNKDSGSLMVSVLTEAYPEQKVFRAAHIRKLLNSGQIDQATKLAQQISDQEPQLTFKQSEQFVCDLMKMTE